MKNKKRVGYVRTDDGINQRATKKWLAIQGIEGVSDMVEVGSYEELRSRLEDGSIYLAVVDKGHTVNGLCSPLGEHVELFTDYQEVGNVDILVGLASDEEEIKNKVDFGIYFNKN